MILLLPFALLLAGDSTPGQIHLFADCSDQSEIVAAITPQTPLKIVSSYAGGSPCYAVVATTPRGPVRGFTNDAALPAIKDFENDRRVSFAARIIAPAAPQPTPAPSPAPAPAAPKPVAPIEKFVPSVANLSLKDIHGQNVTINSGGPTLLFFWVPDDPHSEALLRRITVIQERYARRGLQVIGIGEGASNAQMRDYFDERARTFPQVADEGSSLERRLHVPARPGAAILGADRKVMAVTANMGNLETELARVFREASKGEQP